MAVLSWGKCSIYYAESEDGAVSDTATWTEIDTPKEDSTELSSSAGDVVEAKEEGGAVVDARVSRTTYELAFELFVKKGVAQPWTAEDGVIDGEWAFRVVPEDEECAGILIERSILRTEETYNTADGIIVKYTAKVLKPASGNSVKPYTAA